jgi:hypothetical protein
MLAFSEREDRTKFFPLPNQQLITKTEEGENASKKMTRVCFEGKGPLIVRWLTTSASQTVEKFEALAGKVGSTRADLLRLGYFRSGKIKRLIRYIMSTFVTGLVSAMRRSATQCSLLLVGTNAFAAPVSPGPSDSVVTRKLKLQAIIIVASISPRDVSADEAMTVP